MRIKGKRIAICFVFIVGLLSILASKIPIITNGKPKFVPITEAPCYIKCTIAFPYCFEYIIENPGNSVSIINWDAGRGWAKGKAEADISALLKVKYCSPPIGSATIINEPLNLASVFEFEVRFGKDNPGGNIDHNCIKRNETKINYSTFSFEGNLIESPTPAFNIIKILLMNEIKKAIKNSVSKTTYDYFFGNFRIEEQRRKNVYCGTQQTGSGSTPVSCECD